MRLVAVVLLGLGFVLIFSALPAAQRGVDVVPSKPCRQDVAGDGPRDWPRFVAVTLHENPNFEGRRCVFDGDIPDLNAYGFGNVASSARLRGGIWQLCDKPNYRGYCIELDRSQSNFNLFAFDNRAESVRRIR